MYPVLRSNPGGLLKLRQRREKRPSVRRLWRDRLGGPPLGAVVGRSSTSERRWRASRVRLSLH